MSLEQDDAVNGASEAMGGEETPTVDVGSALSEAPTIEKQVEAIIDVGDSMPGAPVQEPVIGEDEQPVQQDRPTEADLMLEQPDLSKTGEQVPGDNSGYAVSVQIPEGTPVSPYEPGAVIPSISETRFITEAAAQQYLDFLSGCYGPKWRIAKAVIPSELYQLKVVHTPQQ